MTDLVQEISTDYDHDDSEVTEQAFGDDIDMLNSDVKQIDVMEQELQQLLDTTMALEHYGINPTSFGIMQSTGLLNGTALQTLAMEGFSYDAPDGFETEMAMEALADKIKEKMAAWSAKIMNFTSEMATKVMSGLNATWEKINSLAKDLGTTAWDSAKAGRDAIKAHPYRTVVAVVIAAAAVLAIVGMMATGSYANESALKSFLFSVQDKIKAIKWPFGKLVVEVAEDGSRIVAHIEKVDEIAKTSATATVLGWSQTGVKAMGSSMDRLWSAMKSSLGTATSHAAAAAKKFNTSIPGEVAEKVAAKVADKTKSRIGGWAAGEIVKKVYNTALWSLLAVMMNLLRNIVMKAFQVVKETFTALRPVAQTA